MTTDSSVVLGIDGGGTVTRVLCADFSGNIRGSAIGGGAHPGKNPEAASNVRQTILAALQEAGCRPNDVRAVVAGIAGYNAASDETWASELTDIPGLSCPRRHVNDAVVAHAGAFGLAPGIIAISGTGSIVFGVTETGQQVRNYDFNNTPNTSARGIGYEAVFGILIGDVTVEDAPLVRFVFDYWGVTSREELSDLARRNSSSDYAEITRRYGELAPQITDAAQQGSPLAQRVCEAVAEALCVGVRLVGSCFEESVAVPISVALVGSAVRSEYISQAVRRQIAQVTFPRRYQVVEPLLTPGVGAVALALSDAGGPVTPAIRAALQRGMAQLP